jgi:hypothetical protein
MIMGKLIILAVALFLFQHSFGQKKVIKCQATEKEQAAFDKSQDCFKYSSTQFAQRIKNYPFKNAAQVQLVSFKRQNDTLNGVVLMNEKDSLPRQNDTICYSRLFEVKNLTYAQVDNLTDILYNYGYRRQSSNTGLIYIGTSLQCYNPRNAILFLDPKGKVFEFIEICFECEKIVESSSKISLGVMCNQKIGLLKNFFKYAGLEFGITQGLKSDN